MAKESLLFKTDKNNYGENYENHFFEQYKLYVEMADRISSRRQSANSFFLTVNTAVIGVIGYLQLGAESGTSDAFYWLISIAGIALCYTWFRLIVAYKKLNSSKFAVIQLLENKLPTAPYEAEWDHLKCGSAAGVFPFTTFSKVEMVVPWVFLLLHASVLFQFIPWGLIAA